MKMSYTLLTFSLLSSLSFGDVFAYSQNNPPKQHCLKDNKIKEYLFLINADFILSKIIPTPVNAFSISQSAVKQIKDSPVFKDRGFEQPTYTEQTNPTYAFRNKEKIGYRFGMGVSLKNLYNLSVQYTHLRSGNHHTFELPVANLSTIPLNDLQNIYQFQTEPGDTFIFVPYSKQKMREQTLDLLLQTAHWMQTRLRFQPLAGIRLQSFRRDLITNSNLIKRISSQTKKFQNLNSKGKFRIKQMGAFLGCDVKYIFSRRFFLYSNFTTGLLAGRHQRTSTFQWLKFLVPPDVEKQIQQLTQDVHTLFGKINRNYPDMIKTTQEFIDDYKDTIDDPKTSGSKRATAEKELDKKVKELTQLEEDQKNIEQIKEAHGITTAALERALQDVVIEEKSLQQKERIKTYFNPFVQLQFGFGYDDIFSNQLLLSFRVAYELKVQVDPNAPAIIPSTMNTPSPLRYNDYIQTSAFIIGFTLGF